ncbi:uncharacterized protein HD556DRAFT_1442305 [Suillus plorans]|uniref:Uncharacterized protein n=1 Tax=Suillus plorans TaxID=116603 RepID=A0A9P7ASC2_9AGAM|nr:uncharacterized protein HD556DRAFT_1442305 [Suillus plorans]KAG1795448.1 hypothetical protein HD556DRAFT_1442305 [Suillus plorans]
MSTSHNLTTPSLLPLAEFFPSGDNAMFHTRSEPSIEQVMICSPSGRCITLVTGLMILKSVAMTQRPFVPPGAQLIAPLAAAVFENSRSAPPSIAPASSTVSQRQTMHSPAQTTPFSLAAPVFNSQGRAVPINDRRSRIQGEHMRLYEQPDQQGYESSRTAYESPLQRTAYPSGYDGQSATSSAFQEPYPPAGQYSSQPTTSSQYQHPSSSHQ